MIWLTIVALGNMGVSVWLVRENRRLTQMTISRHIGDFTSMVRSEKIMTTAKKRTAENESYATWRNPSEGVAP